VVIDLSADTALDTAGASTCTVDITCDASILLALNLKLFFFFFLAKNDAVSAIVIAMLFVANDLVDREVLYENTRYKTITC